MPEVTDPVVVPDEKITDDTKKALEKIMGIGVGSKKEDAPAEPPMYAVILWNDNSTNPYFVIRVLVEAFKLPKERATQIMFATHLGTRNVVAIMTKDEAETRLATAQTLIRGAVPNKDWYVQNSAQCELSFTIEEESSGKNA